jgi:hypothetical protein
MTLGELLRENQAAIVRRWLDGALAAYAPRAAALFKRQQDPYANPVGHALRRATQAVFEALMADVGTHTDAQQMQEHLHEVIKIRAVQDMSPSQAVGFVFLLKQAVREELSEVVGEPRFCGELAQLEAQIDRIALAAFDAFVDCRQQLCELRVNEVKRTVSWIADKLNRRGCGPQPAKISPE